MTAWLHLMPLPCKGEHSKPGAKYVWAYTFDSSGVENTLTTE
jgi:hypothetical protein